MIRTIDKIELDVPAQLTLETGYTLGWAPGTETYLTGLEGWTGSAPIRRNKADLLGAHGSHAERGFKDERVVTVHGHHVAASRRAAADMAEELAAFLGDGTEGVFRVEDADLGARWAEVYLAGGGVDVKWTGGLDVGFTVFLLCPDPRKYGDAVTVGPVGVPVAGKGLRFPLFGAPTPGVLNLGGGGTSGRATVTNTGKADTGVRHTVTGDSVPGFTITEIGTERRLVYTGTLSGGQVLILDSNDGSVTLAPDNPRDTNLVTAEWTRVPPGGSSTFLFESPGSVNATMTVEMIPAWW